MLSVKINRECQLMSGLRSVTLGTNDLSKTKELFNHIIGLQHSTKMNMP